MEFIKKNLKIIIAGIIILVLILLIYFLNRPYGQVNTKNAGSTKPIEGINEKIFFPAFVPSQNAIYYMGDQGITFKKFSLGTRKVTSLYPNEVPYVQKVKYNSSGTKALILVKINDSATYKIIDFTAGAISDLDQTVFDADWLNDQQIFASFETEDSTGLGIINVANKKKEGLKNDLPFSLPVIALSPDKKNAVIFPEPEGYGNNKIYLYSFSNKSLSQIGGNGLVDVKWSPDSSKFLTFKVDEDGNRLAIEIFEISSLKQSEVPIQSTIEKTTWLDNTNLLSALKNIGQRST